MIVYTRDMATETGGFLNSAEEPIEDDPFDATDGEPIPPLPMSEREERELAETEWRMARGE